MAGAIAKNIGVVRKTIRGQKKGKKTNYNRLWNDFFSNEV